LVRYQAAKRWRRRAIRKAQRSIHRRRVAETKDEKGLRALARWTRNRGSRTPAFTPAIRKSDGTLAEDTDGKAQALRQLFFLQPPEVDLSDTYYYQYYQPKEL
jgi:hypothetical protein